MAFTIATANKIIDKILNATNFTEPTSVYVSLHTSNPGENGASEVTGGTYSRTVASFSAGANKTTSNDVIIEFDGMPATTVTHIGLWDAASGGNFWWGGALTASKTLTAGDTLKIPVGDLDVTLT